MRGLDYANLGKRIRHERKARNLTQEELAEIIGISLSFLGHIERGSRKASLDTLVAISNVLHISPNELLEDSLNWIPDQKQPVAGSQEALLKEINRMISLNLEQWNQE